MIARGGRGLVGLSAVATAAALPFQLYVAAGLAGLTIFLICVFRDPRRTIGDGIVSPADGTVRAVDHGKGLVSIYLALRNVHVTRAPLEGVLENSLHTLGRHRPAFSRGTPSNERLEMSLMTRIGRISIIEMTGAIARRIVPYVKQGQELGKGTKISLIRFGSRVDLYLPPSSVRIVVEKGQKLRAGVTCIAEVCDGRVE
ncbi:MAG: phosphatidylserine decarboxylase [Euryarchaeota archaeon]|nr:phosphatidylserine decarboxylase [Euryarchaeota archaeon]